MKVLLIFMGLYGSIVAAQEPSLLERLSQTNGFATAHERESTKLIVFSEPFRSHTYFDRHFAKPEWDRWIQHERAAYSHDLSKFIQTEHELAQNEQGVSDPHVVIVVQNDSLDAQGSEEKIPVEETLRSKINYDPRYKNVEVVQAPTSFHRQDSKKILVPPIFEAVRYLQGVAPQSTMSFYLMGASPTAIIRQVEVLAAINVLGIKEGISLTIRVAGNNPMSVVAIPTYLQTIFGAQEMLTKNVKIAESSILRWNHTKTYQWEDYLQRESRNINFWKPEGTRLTNVQLGQALINRRASAHPAIYQAWRGQLHRDMGWYQEINTVPLQATEYQKKYAAWGELGYLHTQQLHKMAEAIGAKEGNAYLYTLYEAMIRAFYEVPGRHQVMPRFRGQSDNFQHFMLNFPRHIDKIKARYEPRPSSIKGRSR